MSKKLDNILEKIKKDYKTEVKSADELCSIKRITLDSPGINFLFSGGFPLSKMIAIHGPFSAGKSTLATYIASQIQKKGGDHNTTVWFDFEYSFDPDFARHIGLDTENNFIILRPDNGEDAFLMMKDLIETDEVGLIVIDSATVMPSKSQIEDPNKANFGAAAKLMSNGLRYINPALARHNCSMIILGQERDNVGSLFGADFKAAFSGKSVDYYSSWTARLTRVEDIKNKEGDLEGIVIKVRNTKSKVGIAKREAKVKLYFDKGIDSDDEYLDYLKTLGIIEQRGAWFYNEEWGMKVAGKNGVADFLHERPELYEKVKKQVNALICGHTVLDNEENKTEEEVWSEYTDENFNPETGELIE